MSTVPQEVTYQTTTSVLSGLLVNKSDLPPILCLHGWLDNAASFAPLFPYFNDQHIIALDWPGHGFSSHRSDDAHYHFVDYVYELVQLFAVNQWPALHIVGHSMGGMIASAFAAAFPEHVRSLTLIDSIGFMTEPSKHTTRQLRTGLISRLKANSKQKSLHSNIDSAVNARVNVSDLSPELAALIVARGLRQTELGFEWRSDSRLRTQSPVRLTQAQAKQLIKDIKIPVQLLFGSEGPEMIKNGICKYQEFFKNIVLHSLVGGHHIHMEQPESTVKMIIDFIANK